MSQIKCSLSDLDRPPSSQQIMFANANEYNEYQQFMARRGTPPSMRPSGQPTLPPKPKKKLLRSPLTAIKNAIIKTTRPLRRQTSMNESDSEPKKLKSILKRQNSMMEPRMMNRMGGRQMYPQDMYNMPPQMHPNQYYQGNMGGHYAPGHYPVGRHEPFYPNDSTYTNLESDYGHYPPRSGTDGYYEENENIYANRARIELERRALPPIPVQGPNVYGTNRLVRRHSLRDRRPGNYTPTSETGAYPKHTQYTEEPIYQSKRGSYLLNETRESARRFEESPYQIRRELHRNHLYQSKEEMQERIHQSRREFEKLSVEGAASPTSPTSEEMLEAKRREMKERGYRSKQQLREQIYQSRREAMESMAEPVYVSKRELKQETIYESKHEQEGTPMKKDSSTYKFPPLPPPPKTPPPDPPTPKETKDDSNDSTLKSSEATVISASSNKNDKAPLASIDSEEDEETIKKNNESDIEKAMAAAEKIKVASPLTRRTQPTHISNIIKRTAAPQGTHIYASRTSLETQYMSQTSLPVGPPNAQSTPYASDLSLPTAPAPTQNKLWVLPTVPREPVTTKGVFDSEGGKLEDNLWNVSLVIPKGALPPGVKQEVYFTVTDPRMANQVGGPPLDMENGWFKFYFLYCFL